MTQALDVTKLDVGFSRHMKIVEKIRVPKYLIMILCRKVSTKLWIAPYKGKSFLKKNSLFSPPIYIVVGSNVPPDMKEMLTEKKWNFWGTCFF